MSKLIISTTALKITAMALVGLDLVLVSGYAVEHFTRQKAVVQQPQNTAAKADQPTPTAAVPVADANHQENLPTVEPLATQAPIAPTANEANSAKPSRQSTATQQAGTPNWSTYQNDRFGFAVRYPADFRVETTGSPGDVTGTVVSFKLANNRYYNGTNLVESAVIIGVSQSGESLRTCLSPRDAFHMSDAAPHDKSINGVAFYEEQTNEGAAGGQYETTSYRAIHRNMCYEIALFIHASNMGAYDPGTVTKFNKGEVIKELDAVASTFKFLR